MKIKKKYQGFLFCFGFLFFAVLMGCQQNDGSTSTSKVPSTQSVSPTQQIGAGFNSKEPTLVETATLLPTTTATSVPTLPEESQEGYLLNLFNETEEGCYLPCWWDLIPSKSSWAVVENKFLPLAPGIGESSIGFRREYSSIGLLSISAARKEQFLKEFVIRLFIPETSEKGYTLFKQYSMSQLFKTLGPPTRGYIHLRTATADPSTGQDLFEIWLFYDGAGIAATYWGSYNLPKIYEDSIKVCVIYDNLDGIDLFLSDPSRNLDEISDSIYLEGSTFSEKVRSGYLKRLDTATTLSIEEFYQAVIDYDDYCFESPKDNW